MPYLCIFDQKYPIWVFLGKNFQNTIASSIYIVLNGPVFNLFFLYRNFKHLKTQTKNISNNFHQNNKPKRYKQKHLK